MTDDKTKTHEAAENPMSAWMEAAGGFWETMFETWTRTLKSVNTVNPSEPEASGQAKTFFDATMKAFDPSSGIASDPESLASLFKGAGAMPQILAKAAQTGLNGLLQYQQKWFERAQKMGQTSEAFQYENLDENAFRAWTEVYEKEFGRFFKIPQLGLTRFYQEKMNEVMDKFNIHQATLAEFQRLLYLPITRSFSVMQEKLGEMAQKNPLPEDPKTYYNMWVKILEGHYMTLFQSPEYIETLGKTLSAVSDFTNAKNDIIQDILSSLPIPTDKDVDELYREIYLLKKRIKALEK